MRPLTSYLRPKGHKSSKVSVQDEHFSIPNGFPAPALSPILSVISSSSQEESHFFRLPYEIREQIYRLAFGDRTLHIDLQHRNAYHPGSGHANIRQISEGRTLDHTTPKEWRWWSCVCHRRQDVIGVCCLHGIAASCGEIAGSEPVKSTSECFISVGGWLRSCKQAYLEILPILYSTNTLYISSLPLLQRLFTTLSPASLSLLTSLRLNFELWPEESLAEHQCIKEINRAKRFVMYSTILSQFKPSNFPNLKKLSIEFTSDWHSDGWDIFTQSALKQVPGNPDRMYLLEPTDKIVQAFGSQLDVQIILKPEHAFVVSHKLGLRESIIHDVNLDTDQQSWKMWRSLPVSSQTEKTACAWPGPGYFLLFDTYLQLPSTHTRQEPGPWCQWLNSNGPWAWWTDEWGFVYRRTIAELEMDWGVGGFGGGSGGPGRPNGGASATATPAGPGGGHGSNRVWFDDRDGEWSPLGWLRDRAV